MTRDQISAIVVSVFLSSLMVLLLSVPVAFSAEIGRVTLDGKQIILNSDNTWEYVTKQAGGEGKGDSNCVVVKSKTLPVAICLDEETWKLGAKGGAAEHNFSTKDNNLFLLMITENSEIPLDAFEKAIVANAQKAAGLRPVEVLVNERIDAFGLKWGRMVYVANIEGLEIKYENYFTTLDGKGSVQYVFYATNDNFASKEGDIERAIKQISIE